MNRTTGLFLSLDGLDGCGKTTQCRLLADWFRSSGREVTCCVDPGGTALGDTLRSLLLDKSRPMTLACEALLFMASRAELTAEVIRPALKAGQVVISDRFLLANVVYQGHAGGLDPAQLYQIGLMASENLEPDLTFVMDLPIDLARQRRPGPRDRVESRDADFHERVRAGFLSEARRRPDRIVVIDATQPVHAIQDRIRAHVSHLV